VRGPPLEVNPFGFWAVVAVLVSAFQTG
jgi:hypothetical protein